MTLPAGWTARRPTLADGAALLRRAFAVYAAKGRAGAGLGVDLANPIVPVSLYRSVGLREGRWTDMYERSVTAARDVG